ncbi:MAG: serine O-acetyltransferase EpsC [Desulfovibrionales bacterium]
MTRQNNTTEQGIGRTVQELCSPESYRAVYHQPSLDAPMPSVEILTEIVERLRVVIFPGYFGYSEVTRDNMAYIIGSNLKKVQRLMREQILRGFCFFCTSETPLDCPTCEERSRELSAKFIAALPRVRRLLSTDVQAAYEGDPAAKNPGETIFCYPSIKALTNYRIAHELHQLGVDLIPRIITEMAHSQTGIDIHPGATIGEHFFIDHGTGTVIGETCVIGRNVRLYQGVTLGAKSFPKDATGKLIKGIPRHPVVEDDVTIYSGATLLGRITIGKGSVVGGNVWLTRSLEPGSRVVQGTAGEVTVQTNGQL